MRNRRLVARDRRQPGRDVCVDPRAIFVGEVAAGVDRLVDGFGERRRSAARAFAAGLDAGLGQRRLDEAREPPALPLNEVAVLLHARGVGDQAVREVLPRGPNRGERRAELVRQVGDELDLLAGEARGAVRGRDEHADRGRQEQQDAAADRQVAGPRGVDDVVERSRAVGRHEDPDRVRHPAGTGPAPGGGPPGEAPSRRTRAPGSDVGRGPKRGTSTSGAREPEGVKSGRLR